jgi:hypothetical protein
MDRVRSTESVFQAFSPTMELWLDDGVDELQYFGKLL